jgi:U3 small nucleolar RNA-associated protein 25
MAYADILDDVSTSAYNGLLQALRPTKDPPPSRKKRKLNGTSTEKAIKSSRNDSEPLSAGSGERNYAKKVSYDMSEPSDETGDEADSAAPLPEGEDDDDSTDDEDALLRDPFEQHYFTTFDSDPPGPAGSSQTKIKPAKAVLADGLRKTWNPLQEGHVSPGPVKRLQDLHLKQRLLSAAGDLVSRLSPSEKDIAGAMSAYVDVVAACRTVDNAAQLRDICALHSLNHVFKTRDRVLKNNARLSQAETPDALDLRDQGFTRPKILVMVPTKQACVRFVESIIKMSEPDQQENKSRFLDTFSRADEDEWQEKPADFRELFGGNHEEDFRIGLKFTRKTIKYFSGFYNSDIILCSPLGLMRTITTGGGDKDGKKGGDADFLSSIEIAIMDHASALQMQNWQHVEYAFSQFNQLPKESHGCDFSRVRTSSLEGHSKHLRQTIILSSYLTPEINALLSSQLYNFAGRVKYVAEHKGAMLEVSNILPIPVVQTFLRFDSPSPLTDGDVRFKYFTTTILPQLVRDKNHQQGVLVFIPSYADFVRLRNHLDNSSDGTSIAFGNLSEYTPVKDVSRARSHLMSGRHSLLLYSERAHHHFRYRLRGVRKVIFYGVPENPTFWTEILGLLGLDTGLLQQDSTKGKGMVRALFSRWDIMKLERIVGTERVSNLVSERIGDTFDFV